MAELIPQPGGSRRLKGFQLGQLTDDQPGRFCERYIDRKSRIQGQMAQAARARMQNIAELSRRANCN